MLCGDLEPPPPFPAVRMERRFTRTLEVPTHRAHLCSAWYVFGSRRIHSRTAERARGWPCFPVVSQEAGAVV